MNTKTIIIIVIVVIALTAGIWIWAAKKAPDTSEPAAGTPEAAQAESAANAVKMPLRLGARGTLVKALQTALNKKYNSGLKVDGVWGNKTEAALTAAKLPTVIFWKQWSEITGLSLTVGGKLVTAEKPNPWNPQTSTNQVNYFS